MANYAVSALKLTDTYVNTLPYNTCSIAADTATKTVDAGTFSLETGAMVVVKFTNTNTAANPTLNVSSTGAKAIYYNGAAITSGYLKANRVYTFVYNGTQWDLIGDIDTDSDTDTKVTQSASSTSSTTVYPVILAYSSSTSKVTNTVNKSANLVYTPVTASGGLNIKNTTASSSKTTGALIVAGGVGVGGKVYADQVYGAVWNDYAEYRESDVIEPGRVICENGDDTLSLATERMQPGANIVSDTFGFAIGETDKAKTPIAVSGRVLVYPYEDRNSYKPGDAVCAAPNGTVSKMTREEIREYPERIVGTVSAIPSYDTWGADNVAVNGRIWIKIK